MAKYFFIDTRSRDSARFGWLDEKSSPKLWPTQSGYSGLISSVSLKVKPTDLAKAKGVCVVAGPGTFSSIRTGTLVANLLARIYNLPLLAVKALEVDDLEALARSLNKRRPTGYAAPIYDQEPNITTQKPNPVKLK
ncbi:MAG: hypothetical protein PHC53_02740 [Patescibacteria group bacterium]|nr:hypothetical protein [Patescibacteria group bacterium]